MTTAPCKDCPDRQVGCKSTCPAWAEWEKEKARRVEEKKKTQVLADFKTESIERREARMKRNKYARPKKRK